MSNYPVVHWERTTLPDLMSLEVELISIIIETVFKIDCSRRRVDEFIFLPIESSVFLFAGHHINKICVVPRSSPFQSFHFSFHFSHHLLKSSALSVHDHQVSHRAVPVSVLLNPFPEHFGQAFFCFWATFDLLNDVHILTC